MEPPRLLTGDALAVLAQLDTDSVDAVITDPPYSSGGATRGDRMAPATSKYITNGTERNTVHPEFTGDNRDGRGYAYWTALWISECLRVTRPGGVIAIFADWRQLPTTTDSLQAGGYIWRGIVPWHKPVHRPQVGRFSAACEYVVWGSAGPMNNELGETLPGFISYSSPRDRVHPTQKPLELMRAICQIVPKGGTILDPFMGAGTTGIAAGLEGRRFVGIELSPDYTRIARQRIREHHSGLNHPDTPSLFDPEPPGPPTPKADTSTSSPGRPAQEPTTGNGPKGGPEHRPATSIAHPPIVEYTMEQMQSARQFARAKVAEANARDLDPYQAQAELDRINHLIAGPEREASQ